jgi:hypothetical protein
MGILKSKKFIIILVVTLVALTVSIGGVVMAQDSTTTSATSATSSEKTLMTRVATILGIDEAKLQSAFTQAQNEMQAEELDSRLSEMVTDGTITQKQADDYKAWFNSKPDDSAYRKSLQEWQNAQPDITSGIGLPGIGGRGGRMGDFCPRDMR